MADSPQTSSALSSACDVLVATMQELGENTTLGKGIREVLDDSVYPALKAEDDSRALYFAVRTLLDDLAENGMDVDEEGNKWPDVQAVIDIADRLQSFYFPDYTPEA